MAHQRYFLCVDFEACDAKGAWIAVAAGIFSYPSRCVVDMFMRAVRRPTYEYDQKRRVFWFVEHRAAHDWLMEIALAPEEIPTVERELAKFVREAHRRFPGLEVLSDNPAYDLRMLDNIMQRHDQPPVTERHDGSWARPTCTISFAHAAQMLLGRDWSAPTGTPRAEPPHTPWRDVQDIVDAHFRVLDRIAAKRSSERG